MENDRDFFEEEYSPTGGKKPKAGKWIMLAACFIVACAIAAAYFKFRPDVLKAAPKDIVTAAEPDATPDGAAAAPEATKAPQEIWSRSRLWTLTLSRARANTWPRQ